MLGIFRRQRKRKRGGNFRRLKALERRRRREHVLDVRMPPSRKEEQRARLGRWRTGLKVGLLVSLLATLGVGARYAVARHFWSNGDFLVREPVIKTNGSLTHEEILQKAGVPQGMHMHLVDLKGARKRLESLAVVRRASVEREFHGRLLICIEERIPVAWLACDAPAVQAFTTNPAQGGCLLDEEGVIFPCEELKPSLMKLPVVHTRRLPSVQTGSRVETASVQRALDLLRCSRQALAEGASEIVEVDAPNDWSLVAKFSDDAVVTFGFDEAPAQWQRLKLIMDIAAKEGKRLATANLVPRKNVPITFFESASEETLADSGHRDISPGTSPPQKMNRRPQRGTSTAQIAPAPPTQTPDSILDEILGGGN
ncbi:MAG: cell division protein FtsQ/DivIB [Verrucomicrobiales bacterium]